MAIFQKHMQPRCPDCGYDLRSSMRSKYQGTTPPGATCPECGKESDLWEISAAAECKPWWLSLLLICGTAAAVLAPTIVMVGGSVLLHWGNRIPTEGEMLLLVGSYVIMGITVIAWMYRKTESWLDAILWGVALSFVVARVQALFDYAILGWLQ